MFERYTEQARRAIFFARYEALVQPVDKISTGHLLIGLTRDVGSRADAVGSLKEHEAQLRSALSIPRPPKIVTGVSLDRAIPLDDNSKMVLAYAAQEADRDDSYSLDTDHLLRGILRFTNEASQALQSISVDIEKARVASELHRVKFRGKKTLYHRLFGRPFRAHRTLFIKLLAIVVVFFLSAFLIRWLN